MKYRHSFHAGNFADVHKHVTLLALLRALKRKEKGFAYLETHAGRGVYDLSGQKDEAAAGIGRFLAADGAAISTNRALSRANSGSAATGVSPLASDHAAEDELRDYSALVAEFRSRQSSPRIYPGSPLVAAHELRANDRAVFCEMLPPEARALERALEGHRHIRVEQGDGFERLKAWLPPTERRGLIFIDPPYEETRRDFNRVTEAVADALRRFETGVIAAWYPIKDERDTASWLSSFAQATKREALVSELWLYPRDSRVALNGSGLVIVNPPYQVAERAMEWVPELRMRLDVGHSGGSNVRMLSHAS